MRPGISGDGRGQLGLAVLACGLLAGSAFVPARAHAEAADAGPTSPDIVVTARRIEEAPSALPFSVTVIGGREAQDRRTDDLESALRRTVGVEVSSFNDANNASVRIRGVGALQKVSSDDSSVAVNIDGVPVSIASAVTNLVDIDRIEILKGPQGTIFGRNSEAGAINIVTKRPSSTPGGNLRAEAGEQMQRLVEGAFGGPLAGTLAARGAFRFSGSNHNVINQRDGEPITRPRDQLFRGGLLWSPTSDTSLFLSAEHQEIDARAVLFVLRPYGDPPLADQPTDVDDSKSIDRATLELRHNFDEVEFTSLTGLSRSNYRSRGSYYDGRLYEHLAGMRPASNRALHSIDKQISQELRLNSVPGAKIIWIVGASYAGSRRSFDTRETFDEFFPDSPYNADISLLFRNRAFGLFGEATYPLAERLKLTAGLRQSWERKRYAAQWRAASTNASPLRAASDRQTISDDYVTGRVALSWEAGTGLNLYGVAAFGHKVGGFNEFPTDIAQGLPDAPYGRAKVRSLELGFKYRDPSAGLDLSGAVFDNRNRGDHLLVFDSLSFATRAENFDTHSRGFEIETAWQPTQHLSLSGGLNYTAAEITGVPAASQAGVIQGNRVPDSPEWSAAASIEHRLPLGQLGAIGEAQVVTLVSYRYTGKRAADPQNNFDLPEYHKLDARIALKVGRYEVYAWADNLLDETYDLFGYYYAPFFPGGPDATFGAPGRGRTLGVGLRADF
jgi:iron complex outermembrane receptor protein